MNKLRALVRGLLPSMYVDFVRNRKVLQRAGHNYQFSEVLCNDQLLYASQESSLGLLPTGFGSKIDTVVDVGANVGQWSGYVRQLITPKKHMIIEPVPNAFNELKQKFGSLAGVELVNAAVGDHDGTVTFNITADTTGASVLAPRDDMKEHVGDNWKIEQKVEARLARLDTLTQHLPQISLLKIDVQGYELPVMQGAIETLKKTMFVLVELNFRPQYENGSGFAQIYDELTQKHGFYLANMSPPLCFDREAIMVDGLFANPIYVPRRVSTP